MSHAFITAKMTDKHQNEHRGQQNPAPAQPAPPLQPQSHHVRGGSHRIWVMPWILQREERECYRTPLDEPILVIADISGYRNFIRMPPAFIDLNEEGIYNHLKKSHTKGSHWKLV